MRKSLVLLLVLLCCAVAQLQSNPKGFILTNRLFLFDTTNGNQASNNGAAYSFNFNRNFTNVPRVGLGIVNMDFQYSPVFSCQVSSNTTQSSATLLITTQTTSTNNQLYIMYLATDHDFFGVFMPGPLITYMLNQGTPDQVTQTFPFNFKSQVANSQVSNIRVSVYLTGITSSSQLVSNGYPTNHTNFFLSARVLNSANYEIDVTVSSQYGDISVSQIEYTIIYFDITLMQGHRYLMDKGDVTLQNFGGTADQSSKSITLTALPANSSFSGLNLFYGISGLECKQGATIALSASNQLYVRPNTNTSEFILTMYTFKLTLMLSAEYNFVQYASLNCGLPGANCDGSCLTSPEPHYVVGGVCNYCQSSCLTCNISNSNSRCDSCDATRYLSNSSGLCLCNPGYYDGLTSNVCSSCFPCLTCSQKGICNDCDASLHLVLNTILDSCECAPGFCPNYANGTSTLNSTLPCLSCPQNCLYCLNTSFCLACNTITYLNSRGQCVAICSSEQRFDSASASCSASSSSMYDQAGRLGFEWSYTAVQSQLVILLTFSQPDTLFYYYENGNGYGAANGSFGSGSMQQSSSFYFDDGANAAGYASASSQSSGFASIASLGSSPANIFGNADLSLSSGEGSGASAVSSLFQQGGMQSSALNGSFYGLGEQQFVKYLYRNYLLQSGRSCDYYDASGIPFGKYNLSSNAAPKNPSLAEALKSNIVLSINNETIPFTMVPLSSNQFQLTASVSKSYSGDNGYLLIKNAGLVRSGAAASQLTNASQSIYIYDCAIPSYVSAANNIYESNSIIVQVLWGLGKYPLFIGFGWVFMPLMLALQFVMSLNYVSTTRPLNLDLFLASFADFRNPSIFYNPVRNSIDRSVIDHRPIYRSINGFNRFDRGIDFMANCFQFFFVPFLSVLLYALLLGLNRILNASGKDVPLISNYLRPRLPLHIAAYTLVQALPVSFFFFAQLNDTRYKSLNDPASGYSIFNIAMSYLAFFLTCAVPLMVMTHVYFIYTTKENKVKSAKDFKALFANLLQSVPHNHHIASLNDPLWTGDEVKLTSYGFGLAIYFLAVIYGFFLSFFISDYPWQLTGLILATAGLLAFAAASPHFLSLAMRIFWIVFCALLLAFLFLLAGIGSNASAAPCDQQSLGYLGIGFLYALLLAALMVCCLLLWFTIFALYNNYFKNKPFVVSLADAKEELNDKPERVKGFQSGSKLKSTYMKNPISSQINIGSRVNIGSVNMGGSLHANANRPSNSQFHPNVAEELATEDRMIIKEADAEGEEEEVSASMKQRLIFFQVRPKTGEYVFIREKDRREFSFDENIGRRLKDKPVFIDNNEAIFDRDNQYLGHYENLRAEAQRQQAREAVAEDPLFTANERELVKKDTFLEQPIIRYTSSKELDDFDQRRQAVRPQARVTNIYVINGEEYTKEGEDANGLFIMRNNETNQIRRVSPSSFQGQEQEDILEDNSLEKEMPSNSHSNDGRAQQDVLSAEIENNRVVLQKQRKFRFNGQEYVDLGEDGGFFRLLNKNQVVEKVDRERYIQMALAGFDSRLNLNGIDYDVDFTDQVGNVRLIEVYSKRPKIITQQEFRRLRQQNEAAFRSMVGEEQGQRRTARAEEQANQVTNLLLLQSKAGNAEISNYAASSNNVNIVKQTSTKSVKEIEIVSYPQREEEMEDEETIEKVLEKSPGPFQLLVVPNDKVDEVDGADNYEKDDAIEKIILEGKNVMQFMEKTERKHPRAALFMVDLSNSEEYRLI